MGKMILVLTAAAALAGASAASAQPSPPPAAAPATGVAAGTAATAPATAVQKDDATNFTIENSLSIRDPFHKPAPKGGGDLALLPELERFELDKFNLVGVITGPHHAKAMVTGPSNKMYVIEENTRMGTRHGVVKKIAPGVIYVEEKVINLLGQEESIETPIEFKEKKKEGL